MSDDMKKIAIALQIAVDEEFIRKAKLGYKVVIGDKNGNPKLVSAKYILYRSKASRKL